MKVTFITTPILSTKDLKTGFGVIICRHLSTKLTKWHSALNVREVSEFGSGDLSFCVWLCKSQSDYTCGESLLLTLSISLSGANGLHSSPSR